MPIRRHHGDRHKRDPAAQTVWPEPGKHRGEFDDDDDEGDDVGDYDTVRVYIGMVKLVKSLFWSSPVMVMA